jgi:ParB-like chromosome segregation protein Spo0J
MESIKKLISHEFKNLNLDEQVEYLNEIRFFLHEISPFKDEPVDMVHWVKNDKVVANDYNPNSVAPPEMKLLERSIEADGYTQPIVSYPRDDVIEVVDGFHRHRVGKESDIVNSRVMGYLPVVKIKESQEGQNDRMASTIRHNRARGKHKVESMSEIVIALKRRNWSDKKIGKELGMDPDEVLRLTQIKGLAEMFEDQDFSEAWRAEFINESEEEIIEED